jgi:hypothetical protein
VPDTNALIFNPDIEKWEFDDMRQFTVVLTPPVLSELDTLKIKSPGVETVREKSVKVINKIKEYRRRAANASGKLTDGIVLVTGVSDIPEKNYHFYNGVVTDSKAAHLRTCPNHSFIPDLALQL